MTVDSTDGAGCTPLTVACSDGCTATIELLLGYGVDVNAALRLSCWYEFSDVVKMLLVHGADVNATDEDGKTALMIACKGVHSDDGIVEMLLGNGADVNATDKDGNTALVYACLGEHSDDASINVDIVKMLLAHGADASVSNREGRTALKIIGSRVATIAKIKLTDCDGLLDVLNILVK